MISSENLHLYLSEQDSASLAMNEERRPGITIIIAEIMYQNNTTYLNALPLAKAVWHNRNPNAHVLH